MTPPPGISRRKHLLVMLAIVLVSGVVVFILAKGLGFDQTKIPPTIIGKHAYPFRSEWIQGQEFLANATESTFTLEHLKGKPLILNFWASWCVSCREEAAELEAFWQKHKAEGVAVVGIAIQDTQAAAQKFAQTFGKTYILGLDHDGRISIDYGVTGVPETFLINKEGIVVRKEVGPVTSASLERYLSELL